MCVVDEATVWRKPLFASLLLRAPSGNPQLLAQHEDAHAEKDQVGTEIRRGCDRSNGTAPAAPAAGWCYECLHVPPWPRPSTALPSPGGSRLAQLFVYQTKISSSSLSSSSRAWLRVHRHSGRPLEGSANGSLRECVRSSRLRVVCGHGPSLPDIQISPSVSVRLQVRRASRSPAPSRVRGYAKRDPLRSPHRGSLCPSSRNSVGTSRTGRSRSGTRRRGGCRLGG